MGPLLQVLKSAIREAKLLRELGSHPHIVTLHHSQRRESGRWVRALDPGLTLSEVQEIASAQCAFKCKKFLSVKAPSSL